jgi:pyrimidine-nucleoside phosphorylase
VRPQDLIRIKRDGGELPAEAIRELIAGVTDGSVPDYQAAALLMAIFLRGMNEAELSAWSDAMLRSGRVLDLSSLRGRKVDKHSTGGVGDKVSLCLAPLVAACGVPVPMISGRGLGHTGGTLDKLEAIPGFRTDLGVDDFVRVVAEAGLALIGQTSDLAPADGKLYALRDVTATVESIPLIASSIMSKKLAEGIDALVLDVKVGSGAFMKQMERARVLAETLCGIGRRAGKQVSAFLTDMNQPLGREVGNASETREAIEILRGGGPEDLLDLTLQLGAEMLILGGVTADLDDALQRIRHARRSGAGLERLRKCIELQRGDPRVVDDLERLPRARFQRVIAAERTGFLSAVNAEQIGIAAMLLGAGRASVADRIDHAVGVTVRARIGDELVAGAPLAVLCYNDERALAAAEATLRAAFSIGDRPVTPPPLVYDVLR